MSVIVTRLIAYECLNEYNVNFLPVNLNALTILPNVRENKFQLELKKPILLVAGLLNAGQLYAAYHD